jgi:pSer/pThr/pTyr-binding forkhead associated (FHA) protein
MRTSNLQSLDPQTQGSLTEESSASVAPSDRMATTELRVMEEIFPLQPVTLLGRDANNTIVIPDSAASARHARLSRENGVWWLEDLGSKNGTLLNELPLSRPTTIEPGDVIGIGDLRLVLEVTME